MKLNKNNTCSEDIKKMKKDGSARFCNSCRKHVIDFRNFSAEEILQYFSDHGKPCMMLYEDQLDKVNELLEKNKPGFSLFKKAAAIAGMISVSTLASAQETSRVVADENITQQKEARQSLEVFVTDKNGNAMPGKKLVLKAEGKEFRQVSDENGKCVFYFHDEIKLHSYTITMEETGEVQTFYVASETGNKSEKSVKFVSGTMAKEPEKYEIKGKVINKGNVEINMKDVFVVIEVMENGEMKTVKKRKLKKSGEFKMEIPAEVFKRGEVFISTDSGLSRIEHDGTKILKGDAADAAYKIELNISRHNRRMMVGVLM